MSNIVWLLIIAAVIVALIISVGLKSAYNHEQKEIKYAGNKGEAIFNYLIHNILRSDDILLNNISLNVDGKATEIDNLIINKNGVLLLRLRIITEGFTAMQMITSGLRKRFHSAVMFLQGK